MDSYTSFSYVYDTFMDQEPYDEWADRVCDYLEKYGETYFQPVEGAKLTESDAEVHSGYLEMSNVQVVSEMVNMINITRQYESNQKVMQTYDGSLEIAVNQLGKL